MITQWNIRASIVAAIILGGLMLCASVNAQKSRLPPCPEGQSTVWNKCFGKHTAPNGDVYIGEFKNGKYDGQGTIYAGNGSVYQMGIWVDGKFVHVSNVEQPSHKFFPDDQSIREAIKIISSIWDKLLNFMLIVLGLIGIIISWIYDVIKIISEKLLQDPSGVNCLILIAIFISFNVFSKIIDSSYETNRLLSDQNDMLKQILWNQSNHINSSKQNIDVIENHVQQIDASINRVENVMISIDDKLDLKNNRKKT